MKWEVIRSENDVYQIRKILQLQFPHQIIPPLPSKTESKFNTKSINKRAKYVQRFFNAVCKNEVLCTYQILVEFLMIRHNIVISFKEKMKKEEELLQK
jgi:hypothetical protein